MENFDFAATSDRPALLAIDSEERKEQTRKALTDLGFKVYTAAESDEFMGLFNRINFEVVIIDEAYGAMPPNNAALAAIQNMPMARRRHTAVILLGAGLVTLNPLQAFALSVHCVVNYAEMAFIGQLTEKVMEEKKFFLSTFLEVQKTNSSGLQN